MNLFITGGSGFIGESILARLLGNSQFKTIYVLIRPKKRRSVEKRIHELIQKITPPENVPESSKRIKAIAGNLVYPKLGISERDYEELINSVNQILHNGAIINLGLPIETLRETNVEGTRNVLELAEASKNRGFLKRFDYVSTAFVGGINNGEFTEDDLVCGQSFASTYEQSKYEAELLLNKYRTKFPITIYRPSIVVGDSKTGYSPNFNLFWFMRYVVELDSRLVIPYSSRSKLDIVPVDFVADSIVALMKIEESLGQTFHLTAGRGNEVKFHKIAKDTVEIIQLKNYFMVPLWVFNFIVKTPLKYTLPKKFRDILNLATPILSYFEGKSVSFNSEKTEKILMNYGIAVPDWDSYKHKILNYCIEMQWGKLNKQPQYMYYCHVKGAKGVLKNDRLELERRKYRRIEKKHFMARFRLKQYEELDPPSTNWDTVVLKDISAGGMLFNYNENLELDSLLDLKIDVPKYAPTINCVGKVIRNYKPQSASMYDIAIRFIDIRRQEKELLIKMMLSQN